MSDVRFTVLRHGILASILACSLVASCSASSDDVPDSVDAQAGFTDSGSAGAGGFPADGSTASDSSQDVEAQDSASDGSSPDSSPDSSDAQEATDSGAFDAGADAKADVVTDSGTPQGFKNAFEMVKAMKLGWNLGNSLDAWYKDKSYHANSTATETHWGNPKTTKAMIDAVAAAGFRSIRIPVTYANHMNSSGIIDKAWLDRVEEVVGYALANNLYTIVNVHHDAGMEGWIYCDAQNYAPNEKALVNIWSQVSERFKNHDNRLLFELTNEILNPEKSWDWGKSWDDFRKVHDLSQAAITTIRNDGGNNTSRYIVVSTFGASTDSEQLKQLFYKKFDDPTKDHLIISLHNYAKTPSSLPSLMDRLGKTAAANGTPIILDEFGTVANDPLSTRLTLAASYVSEARKQGIATFVWDNGGDYAILDRNKLNWSYLSIKEALVGASEADQVPAQGIRFVNNRVPVDTYTVVLTKGATHTIMPYLSPRNSYTESPIWASSNSAICTIDKGGKVTAVAAGTATIKASIANGKSAGVTVTVQ